MDGYYDEYVEEFDTVENESDDGISGDETGGDKNYRHGYTDPECSQESFKDESEEKENSISVNPEEITNKFATATRCRLLEEELRLLKWEKNTLVDREEALIERLNSENERYRTQQNKLLEAEKHVASLQEEIELIIRKSEARQELLEKNYRELCEKVCASEEATHKTRLEICQLQTRNSVLQELLESKSLAINELEKKINLMEHPRESFDASKNAGLNDRADLQKVDVLSRMLEASNKQLEDVVMELANCIAINHNLRNGKDADSAAAGVCDCVDLLIKYNRAQIRIREMEIDQCNSGKNGRKVEELELQIERLNAELKDNIKSSKESERGLRESHAIQTDELKFLLSQTRAELSFKREECVKLQRGNDLLKQQLEVERSKSLKKSEDESKLQSQLKEKVLEIESLKEQKKDLERITENLIRDNKSLRHREKSRITAFDHYTKNTNIKLYKMELLLNSLSRSNLNVIEQDTDDAARLETQAMAHQSKSAELEGTDYKTPKEKLKDFEDLKDQITPLQGDMESGSIVKQREIEPHAGAAETYDAHKQTEAAKQRIPDSEASFKKLQGPPENTAEMFLKREQVLLSSLKSKVVESYTQQQQITRLKKLLKKEKRKRPLATCKSYAKSYWCRFKRMRTFKAIVPADATKRESKTINDLTSQKRPNPGSDLL